MFSLTCLSKSSAQLVPLIRPAPSLGLTPSTCIIRRHVLNYSTAPTFLPSLLRAQTSFLFWFARNLRGIMLRESMGSQKLAHQSCPSSTSHDCPSLPSPFLTAGTGSGLRTTMSWDGEEVPEEENWGEEEAPAVCTHNGVNCWGMAANGVADGCTCTCSWYASQQSTHVA